MPHGLEWERPLSHVEGSPSLLDGIDIYYDFDWASVIGHNRRQFTNGKCLALFVRRHCPDGLTPALLLTKEDVQPHPRLTDTHFFFVVNLPQIVRAYGDVAESLYAGYLESEISRLSEIQRLAADPEMAEAVLTIERVAEWLGRDPERQAQLYAALGPNAETSQAVDISELARALRALNAVELDEELVAAFAEALGPEIDPESRLELLRALTHDQDGRYATGEILVERTGERIADARNAMAAYQGLLDDPATGETAMQEFIEQNLWLLGLDYAKMIPQQRLLSGRMDFILERFDGYQDVLELKDPQDPIVVVSGDPQSEAAPPPSAYGLSPVLAQALGQVHSYRDRLTRHADATEDLLGLPLSRDPRLIIVIGRADRLDDQSQRVLGELNKSLHRVEVVPYDVLAKRADAVLGNVEKYLLAVSAEADSHDRTPEVARG
jgi:phosphoglycolate phosphatase-like HAD superfamily hydrolase